MTMVPSADSNSDLNDRCSGGYNFEFLTNIIVLWILHIKIVADNKKNERVFLWKPEFLIE